MTDITIRDGSGRPVEIPVPNENGQALAENSAPIVPASDWTTAFIAATQGAAGDAPPPLATNASGLFGWLRKIVDALGGTLKTTSPLALPSGITALSGSISPTAVTGAAPSGTATGTAPNFLIGPFTPQLNRQIWATLVVAAGTTGTVQILRSTDAGATMTALTKAPNVIGSFTLSGAAAGPLINEQILAESDAAASLWLSVSLTAGSLTYRIGH